MDSENENGWLQRGSRKREMDHLDEEMMHL